MARPAKSPCGSSASTCDSRTTRAGPSRCSERLGEHAGHRAADRIGERIRRRASILTLAVAAALCGGRRAWAQDPVPGDPPQPVPAQQDPQPARPLPLPQRQDPQSPGDEVLYDEQVLALSGRTVRTIRVQAVDAQRRVQPLGGDAAEAILRGLATRVGQPFEVRKVSLDVYNLWHERRIAVRAFVREDGDQVELVLRVEQEVQIYERVEFKGLRNFDQFTVDSLLGLGPDRQVTSTEAEAMRKVLLMRYRRDGYAFCSIDLRERQPAADEVSGDRPRKVLTFLIDEGPKVTVGEVRFRGNVTFAAEPVLGFIGSDDYLVRESHIESDPAGGLSSGGPFSRELIEEDLDRLRLFYRSRGFLDANVQLASVNFRNGYQIADLAFLVVEGPRYRIRSIRLQHVDAAGNPVPSGQAAYPVEAVAAELKTKEGDFYDHGSIRRDLYRIESFYGERGHPAESFPGMRRIPGAFRVQWPQEILADEPVVDLVFEIFEGQPKTLHEVLIRGNTYTRDRVIRRKVFALPGERIDMTEVEKSIRFLEQTQFFQNPVTLQGPQFELLAVPGAPDEVDLAIDVTEGETGDLRWGLGISTGAGAQALVEFRKRNFDLFNTPSSWNPITAIGEMLDNRAFHGGGQTLNLRFAPGTRISEFRIEFTDPDIFEQHFDTIEMRVNGWRTIRRWREGYTADSLGIDLGFSRNFTEKFSAGISVRQETVDIENLAPDATSLVYDAEGQNELRGIRAQLRFRDIDNFLRPSKGVMGDATYEVLGGPFGADEDMWKLTLGARVFVPLFENPMGQRTILELENTFGWAEAFGSSENVFQTERFFLGGANLRGFDFRGAGPTQFGRALGGEAVYSSTLQISHPLVSTRLEREIRNRELLRGVLFADFGLLGLGIDDPTFREPRLSVGFGVRIEVPVLQIPIALDLGWPLLYEETDDRRQLFFSITR